MPQEDEEHSGTMTPSETQETLWSEMELVIFL